MYFYLAAGTVSDIITGLIWTKSIDLDGNGIIDASDKRTLAEAAEEASSITVGGYSDWRLPTIKELQRIVDYSRSPATTKSPAIDPLFTSTKIKNEAGQDDYGYYWSSTTHSRSGGDSAGSARWDSAN